MSKEIIVDCVNVAECIHHLGHLQEYLGTNKCEINGKCEREKNCYYKQLQRLKQELSELQKLKDEGSLRVAELATENAKLKNTVMKKCPLCGEGFLNNVGLELYEQNEKYKQALEEIREIAEKAYKREWIDAVGVGHRILDKINEVLDE